MRLSEPGRHHLATLIAMGVPCCVATYDIDDVDLRSTLASAELIVDALLGYGARGEPHGEVRRLLVAIRDAGRPILRLDIPSGVDPDTGRSDGQAVVATATLALALPKVGLGAGDAPAHVGRRYLGDIGIPAAVFEAVGVAVGHPFATGPVVELVDR
jgi:NAD(P)H-hydrate epimerase